jgi:hypothetical protein
MAPSSAPEAPLAEKYLIEGNLKAGETALLHQLKEHSDDDQARFGLGALQFVRAVEKLAQDMYRYGLRSTHATGTNMIPFVRLPVPDNPNPETLTYHQARKILSTFLENLAKAEATLEPISDPNVKLPLHFGLIRLDLNGDGKVDEDESLWKLYAGLNGPANVSPASAKEFYICFDRGDVHWLRGYCHLLMSFCEIYLAHDSKETFDCTAHIFFQKVDSPYGFLSKGKRVFQVGSDADVTDFVALLHTISWPVVEPDRMHKALGHLEAVVAQSKESWKWIMAETDDDHEWIPNPRQTGVIPGVRVTEQMVTTWLNLMDQNGKVLSGELLVPFWRGDDDRGVNVRKVFMEPTKLDLVLWVQGTAAAPYLENGPKTDPGMAVALERAFGNNFPGFAVWFN